MFKYMYECLARCRSKGGNFLMTVENVRAQPQAASGKKRELIRLVKGRQGAVHAGAELTQGGA